MCVGVCVCVCESNCSICNFCFSINIFFLYRCSQLSTTVDTPQTAESVGADAERKRAQSPSQIGWCAACGQQHHGGWGKFAARNRLTQSPQSTVILQSPPICLQLKYDSDSESGNVNNELALRPAYLVASSLSPSLFTSACGKFLSVNSHVIW